LIAEDFSFPGIPREGKLASHALGCTELYTHALKGQKLLAQGNALGTVGNQQDAL